MQWYNYSRGQLSSFFDRWVDSNGQAGMLQSGYTMERMVAPGIDSIRRDFMYSAMQGAEVEVGQVHYRSSGADRLTLGNRQKSGKAGWCGSKG